jgi:hypothetical protein
MPLYKNIYIPLTNLWSDAERGLDHVLERETAALGGLAVSALPERASVCIFLAYLRRRSSALRKDKTQSGGANRVGPVCAADAGD